MKNDSTELHFFAEVRSFLQRKRDLIFLLMRTSVVNLVITLACTYMAYSIPANGQNIETTKVKLAFADAPIQQVFDAIEAQTDFSIAVPTHKINTSKYKVSIEAGTYTVKKALDLMLKGSKISYEQSGNFILIDLENDKPSLPTERRTSEQKTAQLENSSATLVTGNVKDAATQEPLAGVNIIVKGTTRGTTTDERGQFGIDAEFDDVLVFSFIGYMTIETPVEGRSIIDLSMESDATSLGEVVVNAGYWEVKGREKTGSIVRVNSDEIQKQPVSNPLAALQGRVPGLEVTQLNGVPGGNFTVRIRGRNSIASGNDPLYVIDGVPFISTTMAFPQTSAEIQGTGTSPLNSISPSDIQSIEVLKDADATAIYGSRGANGVILITTKKGISGQTKVNVNFYTGIANVGNKVDLLTTDQYLEMRREAFKNDAIAPTIANAPDLLLWDTTRYTDWQEVLLGGTARTTDANLTIGGGEGNSQFLVGGNYHKETTVFPGDNSDQRISTHFSFNNTSPNKKFKTSLSMTYSVNVTDLNKQDLTRFALSLPPNAPKIFNEKGELNWENSTWDNPLSYIRRKYEANTNNLIGNVLLSYQILPSLELKSSIGYTNTVMKAVTRTPISSQNPAFAINYQNQTAFANSNFNNWIIEPQLNWKSEIGEGHLDVLFGSTFLDQEREGMSQIGLGFHGEALMKNLSAAPITFVAENYYSQYRYHAIFGRVNCTWKDKYILNLTGRRDGSSRFGPGRQFANFGAIGAAWIFSSENFSRAISNIVSFGKLRSSFGVTGNDQIGDYSYLDTYSPSGPYKGVIGLIPTRLYNPNFGWEANKKLDVAIELGLLDNRVSIEANYYNNTSSNQLVGYPLPPTAGFSSILSNLPAKIQNMGYEFILSTTPIEKHQFKWDIGLNVSMPTNKLVEYPNLTGSSYANTYVEGKPLSIRKTFKFLGVNPQTGLYEVEDVNGDGVFSTPDLQTVNFVGQDYYGGLLNTFSYKGLQLDIALQFIKQAGYNMEVFFGSPPGNRSNQPTSIMDRWQADGDVKNVQRFTTIYSQNYSYQASSDNSITDTSFIRLKNVSLSYNFAQHWIGKHFLKTAKVFVYAQNLLTITDYKGLDPEFPNSVLPPLRTITGGVNLTF